ncbi:MAG TPA: hypothetical protein VHD90_05950 [Phototrophicaceae bacterium]|nr:hypothetical protein [Phototrophicaceae bacterium]
MADDLILAIFPSRKMLTRALDHLVEIKELDIQHAAIVAKARNGEVVVLNDELGPDEGGITGGTLGAAIAALGMVQFGALALPGIGAIIAVGAGVLVGGLVGRVTGRFAANLLDSGYRKEEVETLAARLQAGHPALVLEVKDTINTLPRIREELSSYRAELVEQMRATVKT